MSLTVRLQGLPPTATNSDVCSFFSGMKIAAEGVTITGASHGEAFVTFQDNNNFLTALTMSGQYLLDSPIDVSAVDGSQDIHGYVRIIFRPLTAKFFHVKSFLKELSVESVIFFKRKKVNTGVALVKFGIITDAQKFLSMYSWPNIKMTSGYRKITDTFTVLSARKSCVGEWVARGGKIDSCPKNRPSHLGGKNSSFTREFYARLVNVSLRAEKSHIKKFFHKLVDDSRVTFLYDINGNRQRECFVRFLTEDDYILGLKLDKRIFKGRCVRVLPVSKENVELIETNGEIFFGNPISGGGVKEPDGTYLYLRNFAACVNKGDVLNFFAGFSLTENDVCLLYDDRGESLGEALVKFSTPEEASMAVNLNQKRFQDTEILVRCISKEQLNVFGVYSFLDRSTAEPGITADEDLCAHDVFVSEEDDLPQVTCYV